MVPEALLAARRPAPAKRAFDIAAAITLLILTAPLFLVLAALVRLSSRGPVFFVHSRVGLGGVPFAFYKFRTMLPEAEQLEATLFQHAKETSGPAFKLKDDPRVTRIGRFLRKSSLDELPQLLNVLKGDMSLVGPRPPPLTEAHRYQPHHWKRLSVIPGITGLWQVSGRSNITDFEQRVALDLHYIERWSMWLDLVILARTIPAVLFARGAT